MFPNLRAEITRRNLTFAEVVAGILAESGVQISITHFSLKMTGKYGWTLEEAFAIKKFLKTKLSIDELFQPQLEGAA